MPETVGDEELGEVLSAAADAVVAVLAGQADWGPSGAKVGQYHSDVAADAAALAVLDAAGLGVLSEETGRHHPERAVTVVVDPLDGSTNASRGLSWWATSLCAVDADGPREAVVVDLVHGTRWQARRGGGATVDGEPVRTSGATRLAESIVGLNGMPAQHLGWAQFRALGAAALDLCAVAAGRLDAFVDCTDDGLGPWDYLGGLLVCQEAGATVVDLHGRDLVALDHRARRTVVAGATAAVAEELAAARRGAPPATPPGSSAVGPHGPS